MQIPVYLRFAVPFLSTPSARRATPGRLFRTADRSKFLSTPSARRATSVRRSTSPVHQDISIHALREEGDQASPRSCSPFLYHFYPRPPRGGRPSAPTAVCKARRNFYPRPPRGGRHLRMAIALQHIFISIHALREEGDCITVKSMHRAKQFLSTPSARRATLALTALQDFRLYFYPRPPRGGRLWLLLVWCPCAGISIHALREEGDSAFAVFTLLWLLFLSTPSARRATFFLVCFPCVCQHFYPRPPRGGRPYSPSVPRVDGRISIHALREEGDCFAVVAFAALGHFYPRPPRGGRPQLSYTIMPHSSDFYPRPPRGGRLGIRLYMQILLLYFYPRPPRGGRPCIVIISLGRFSFLSTPSARRATSLYHFMLFFASISIHALREEGDFLVRVYFENGAKISIHALREEGDCFAVVAFAALGHFYPRPPRGGRRPFGPVIGIVFAISIHALREEGDRG